DITQSFAKIPVDLDGWNVRMAAGSAHKIGGPKGVGFLYKSRHEEIMPIMFGGGQESGLRPGTENVAGIVGFAHAAALMHQKMDENATIARDSLERSLESIATICSYKRIGDPNTQSPYILPIELINMTNEEFFARTHRQFALSDGSACNASTITGSHVIEAMKQNSASIVRLSFH
ncbi:MAG: aminotransferase class V-fold PLP-dependent enzyme, partial [Candidatus Riflebacteria bacterium]